MSDQTPVSRAVVHVLLYAAARIALAAVLAAAIMVISHVLGVQEFPFTVALALALVVALPLGMWIFAPLRRNATAGVAEIAERRRTDREQLQARLRGEESE